MCRGLGVGTPLNRVSRTAVACTLAVATGEPVTAGQLLCQAGQTGDATTPHLHFEVWVGGWQAPGGQPIDPLPYLLAWDHSAPAAP